VVKDVVRESILADPALVLDDRDMIRALLNANSDMGRNVVDLRGVLIDRHRAILAVIAPKTFEAFLHAVSVELPGIMALDSVKLCFEGDGVRAGQALGPDGSMRRSVLGLPKGGAAAYCGENGPVEGNRVILRRATRAGTLIYGDHAPTIMSEAILKLDLGEGNLPGLLIFGARDALRFHPEQGTDLLSFFGSAFSLAMDAYRSDVASFLGFLSGHWGGEAGLNPLKNITVTDMRSWMAQERRDGLGARVSAIRGPKTKERLPRPVAPQMAKALIANTNSGWTETRDCAVLTLLYGCGLRISEALGLQASDAPLGNVLKIKGKGGKERLVPVLPVAQEAVEAYRSQCPYDLETGPLFLGTRGGALNPRQIQKAIFWAMPRCPPRRSTQV